MAILVLAFLVTMTLMFTGLVLALRPTREQKAIHRRLTGIKIAPGEQSGDKDEIGKYLTGTDPGSFGWIEAYLADSSFSRVDQADPAAG